MLERSPWAAHSLTHDLPGPRLLQKHLVFGDMGAGYAFTLCNGCTGHPACTTQMCERNRTVGLISEVETADMMLHVGDYAYDLGRWVLRQNLGAVSVITTGLGCLVAHRPSCLRLSVLGIAVTGG